MSGYLGDKELGYSADDTSLEAAESMKSSASKLREMCYNFIDVYGGLTCDELEQITGRSHQTISARCTELDHADRIGWSLSYRRKTRSGSYARVYFCW